MNPIHLAWIIPLCIAVGIFFTSLGFSSKLADNHAKYCFHVKELEAIISNYETGGLS